MPLSLKTTASVGTQAYIISDMHIIARKYPAASFILLSGNIAVDEYYFKHTILIANWYNEKKAKLPHGFPS